MGYADIRKQDVPCWYQLDWDAEKAAFVLGVHKEFIRTTPIIKGASAGIDLGPFAGDLSGKEFGFNGALKRSGEDGDFIRFIGDLPVAERETRESCPYCVGTGKNPPRTGEECEVCNGSGHKIVSDFWDLYALVLSLKIFKLVAYDPEIRTSSQLQQLLKIDLAFSQRSDKIIVDVGGEYSRAMRHWLISLGSQDIDESVRAMKSAWFKMRPFADQGLYERIGGFKSSVANGYTRMDCPGNACGLDPDDGTVVNGDGYRFSGHNIDTPVQQLSLLAGLAALHSKARKEITQDLTVT